MDSLVRTTFSGGTRCSATVRLPFDDQERIAAQQCNAVGPRSIGDSPSKLRSTTSLSGLGSVFRILKVTPNRPLEYLRNQRSSWPEASELLKRSLSPGFAPLPTRRRSTSSCPPTSGGLCYFGVIPGSELRLNQRLLTHPGVAPHQQSYQQSTTSPSRHHLRHHARHAQHRSAGTAAKPAAKFSQSGFPGMAGSDNQISRSRMESSVLVSKLCIH
jgi:hypothetical protein